MQKRNASVFWVKQQRWARGWRVASGKGRKEVRGKKVQGASQIFQRRLLGSGDKGGERSLNASLKLVGGGKLGS